MTRFALDHASDTYKTARADLLDAEKALRDQAEAVAAMRRNLPADTLVTKDYTFTEMVDGAPQTVKLSDLFGARDTLMVAHYMWAPKSDAPCPMCSMWTASYNAVQKHLNQRTSFVVAAKKDAGTLSGFAQEKGWTDTRFVSTGGTSFNRDFGMEDADENQDPGVSVFTRDTDGTIRHFYTISAIMGPDSYRGMDLTSPVWNYFDLLPHGRGDFMPKFAY